MCQIDWTSIAIIFATLAGPILAVWAADIRAEHHRIHERKETVFFSLVSTRGARMQFEHVAALNRIELVFPRLSHPHVVDAWELYLKHLCNEQGQSLNKEIFDRWAETADNLFHDMLQIMATDLKIPFSKTSFKYNAYYPIGYARTDSQINEIRELLVALLKNERTLKMTTSIIPGPTDEDMQSFIAMHQLWKDFLGGRTSIPVRMEEKAIQQDNNE
jgi:hypothetical protein